MLYWVGGTKKTKTYKAKNHLVAIFFSHQKIRGQAAGSAIRPRLPPISSPKLSCDGEMKRKASPAGEGEEGWEEFLCYEETVTGFREPFLL